MKTTTITASIVAGLLTFALAGCNGDDDAAEVTTPTSEAAVATTSPSPQPTTTEPTSDVEIFDIGDTASVHGMDLTINSIEVVPSFVDGGGSELKPTVDGRELLLLHSTFTNTGTKAIDLTCSGLDWYMQGFDTNNNELAGFYDMDRYPGNPKCNAQTLNGETVDWTFAYEIPESSDPGYLTFQDVYGSNDPFAIRLDPNLDLVSN